LDLEERLRRALPLIMRQLESIKLVKGNGELNQSWLNLNFLFLVDIR